MTEKSVRTLLVPVLAAVALTAMLFQVKGHATPSHITLIGAVASQFSASSTMPGFTVPAGNQRLLVVVASDTNATDIQSVLFNPGTVQNLTQAVELTDNIVAVDSIFVLAMGSGEAVVGDIAVLTGGSAIDRKFIAAAVFDNVDQNNPFDNPASGQAALPVLPFVSALAVDSRDGDLVFDVFDTYLFTSAATISPGVEQHLLRAESGNVKTTFNEGFAHYGTSIQDGAPQVTSEWSSADAEFTIHVALNIRAAGIPCPAGSFLANAGDLSCAPADAGHFVALKNANVQTPCPVGHYQGQSGQTSCIAAPIGYYVDTERATVPTMCPVNTTTLATGATTANDCLSVNTEPTITNLSTVSTSLIADINTPLYAALGPDGNWYISSFNDRKISRYQTDGTFVDTFIDNLAASPAGVAFDADGNFYFTQDNGEIRKVPVGTNANQAFARAGTQGLRQLVYSGSEQKLFVTGITDGNIYSIDLNSSPTVATAIPNINFAPNLPTGIAIKDASTLYVTEFNTGKIWEVPTASGPATEYASAIPGPTGLLMLGSEELYVASNSGHAIYKIASGQTSLFGRVGFPYGLAAGPNGSLVAPQFQSNSVGHFTPDRPLVFSVDENNAAVVDVDSIDDSDSESSGLSYSIAGGEDQQYFDINSISGALTFRQAPDFEQPTDLNGDNEYKVRVQVVDSGALSDSVDITVAVLDVLECPESAGTAAELNHAINCYNTIVAPGAHTVSLTQNILLTAPTPLIHNPTPGVKLVVDGGGFSVNAQNNRGVRAFEIAVNTDVTFNHITITGGNIDSTTMTLDDYGGAILNGGRLTLTDSTIESNYAALGGGVFNYGYAKIDRSLISGNTAEIKGGGISSGGSHVVTEIANSTIYDNRAPEGGGVYVGNRATTTIVNSTLANNQGHALSVIFHAVVNLSNSILVGSTTDGSTPLASCRSDRGIINFSPGLTNLIDRADRCDTRNVNYIWAPAFLDGLADNGGHTKTMALFINSPAINRGDNAICSASPVNSVDQRGESRPQKGVCDLGAFESDLLPCFAGTYLADPADSSCTLASAGYFVATHFATEQTACPVGKFQDQTGQIGCKSAPPGTFVSTMAATTAMDCTIGRYQPASEQSECIDAPIGSYVDSPRATMPTDCPVDTSTLAVASTSANDCLALPTVTLRKQVDNNHGGTADSSSFDLTLDGNVVAQGVATLVADGQPVVIGESAVTGYAFNRITGEGCPQGLGESVTLTLGEAVDCTIVNNDIAPTVTLYKDVTNNDGGTANIDDFALTVGGTSVLSGQTLAVTAGSAVAINETVGMEYSFVEITGDAKCPAELGETVVLQLDEHISCTIHNDDIAQNIAPVFTGETSKLSNMPGNFTSLGSPLYAAEGPDGHWYISSFFEKTISRVSADGGVSETFLNTLASPAGVVFDALGNFYYTQDDGKIYKLVAGSNTPELLTTAGTQALRQMVLDQASGMLFVTGISDGNIYAIDINAVPVTASPIPGISFPNVDGRGLPTGIAIKDANTLYVTEFNSGIIWEVPVSGGAATQVASGIPGPTGLAVGALGELYIASNTGNAIYVIDGNGTRVFSALAGPYGLTFTADGSLIAPQFVHNTVSLFEHKNELLFNAEENQTDAVDIDAMDDRDSEGNGLSYSIVGGNDQGLFEITTDTGQLAFVDAPDFEMPQDHDQGNDYEVQVQVMDGEGLLDQLSLVITVTDVLECVEFPMMAANEHEFNIAILCYNELTTAGIREVTLTGDIMLNTTTAQISNVTEGAQFRIDGAGFKLDGQNITGVRPLSIAAGTVVELDNIEITRGAGGLHATGADVTISDSTIRANSVFGGIFSSDSTLTIRRVVIDENESSNDGAAVYARASDVTIIDSVLSNSISAYSGGGLYSDSSMVSIVRSSIHNNRASANVADGGAIWANGGSVNLSNSTVSRNRNNRDSSVFVTGTELTVTNSTIVTNTGGITYTGSRFTLENSIVANQVSGSDCRIFGSLISAGHNLDSDGSCGLGAEGDISAGNADLGSPRDNGGATFTAALGPNSDAINAGDNLVCATDPINNVDQRGEIRPQGGNCDIGAFESRGPLISSPAVMTVAEGDTNAIDLDAIFDGSDEADTGLTYAFYSNGTTTDNDLFGIDPNTGEITFDNPPNYEAPADGDGDNEYILQVEVADAHGGSRVVSVVITVEDIADSCPAETNRWVAEGIIWQLLSLPCQPPEGATFASLFPSGPPDAARWAAYGYDLVTNRYQRLGGEDALPDAGVGFWFISLDPVLLAMPEGSELAYKVQSAACESDCYGWRSEDGKQWNLLGNPSMHNIRYDDIQLTNEQTSCTEEFPCSLDNAQQDHDITSGLYIYNTYLNGNEGDYKRVMSGENGSRVLKPWDGAWVRLATEQTITDPWFFYLPPYPSQFIFVTDVSYDGALGAEQAGNADEICAQEALSAGLPGSYKAWLSDSGNSPASAFSMSEVPYILIDGKPVAADFSALIDGNDLDNPVNLTARWQDAGNDSVWTNTAIDGTAVSEQEHCQNWSSNNSELRAIAGRAGQIDQSWTNDSVRPLSCDTPARLYCVGQLTPAAGQ